MLSSRIAGRLDLIGTTPFLSARLAGYHDVIGTTVSVGPDRGPPRCNRHDTVL
jgi:hypothetical protein